MILSLLYPSNYYKTIVSNWMDCPCAVLDRICRKKQWTIIRCRSTLHNSNSSLIDYLLYIPFHPIHFFLQWWGKNKNLSSFFLHLLIKWILCNEKLSSSKYSCNLVIMIFSFFKKTKKEAQGLNKEAIIDCIYPSQCAGYAKLTIVW